MNKKILLLISFIFLTCALFSNNEKVYVIKGEMTLLEVAEQNFVPVKKIASYLELDYTTTLSSKTLTELNVSNEKMKKQLIRFEDESLRYAWNIVAIGMLVVFIALSITWGIVSQLRHFGNKEKKAKKSVPTKTVQTSAGKVSGPEPDVSTNAIIAAITALHLHNLEVEETNKMMLTWRRAPISMWKQYYKVMMPNREYHKSSKRS